MSSQEEPEQTFVAPSLVERLRSPSDEPRLPSRFLPGQQARQFTIQLPAVGVTVNFPLGFLAHSLWVDNWSSQWVYLANLGHFVPPNVGAWLMPVPDGTETLQLTNAAPQGITQPASSLATAIYLTAYEERYLPTAASPVTG